MKHREKRKISKTLIPLSRNLKGAAVLCKVQ
jgi:hypothetical protein